MGYKSNMLVVHVLNQRIMSVSEDDKRQPDRQTYSSQKAQTYIKEVQVKWGYKIKVLRVHVLNPRMMSVGEDNNRHTVVKDEQAYIRSAQIKSGKKVKWYETMY